MVIAVTRRGSQLAAKLAADFKADLTVPHKFAREVENGSYHPNPQSPISNLYSRSALAEVRRCWPRYNHLILVMPTGVAVRAIAPLLGHKASDPAVVCLDEAGQSVIPLLGGHQAGANELAQQIAALTGGYAAITTASDVQGKPTFDLPPLGEGRRWQIDSASALTHASACLVNDEALGVYLDPALASLRPQLSEWLGESDNLVWVETLDELDVDAYAAGLIISHQVLADHHQHLLHKCVLYRPPVLVIGLGCKRGVPATELREALETTLTEANLALESMAALATVDLKADEPGLQDLARQLDLPLRIVESARLSVLESAQFSPSAAQTKLDLPGVAEPCALLVAGGELIVPKRSFARCTVAVALKGKRLKDEG
jgi:cobalt-precorrin 5A hydrolase/precorrin-3B C17-methyltransferase